ncbi:MAG TPA: SpoVR family protein [Alphaproteobacteria bacterium]
MNRLETTHAPLFTGSDWDYEKLLTTYGAIEEIAFGELGLDIYANQIEVITAEQMLDAYSSVGMPLMYKHWSFGKHFARDEVLYRKGLRGLAYEIVINSNPCISYVMEENSMALQTLVMAHAAFGHNHFFKNNHLFQQWTDADSILNYLEFAKNYIAKCEEKHGFAAVEKVLDAAHALMNQGVNKYPKKRKLDLSRELTRQREREQYEELIYNDLWRTVPKAAGSTTQSDDVAERKRRLRLPEENLLYFLEKTAPKLQPWQRELLRIVRNIAQYFYPQRQTKVMNEGCATFVHYHIVNRLYDTGRLAEGAMLEILDSHTAVVRQPEFDDPAYGGINPYTLGFGMMQDIVRIATEPTDEDRSWFPDMAGNRDPYGTLRHIWANYRDESFILQCLSPHLIRKMKLFTVRNDAEAPDMEVTDIHDESGYKEVRRALARSYDVAELEPDIQVVDVDLSGDRRLILQHRVRNGVTLDKADTKRVLRYVASLWGYPVRLVEIDAATERWLHEHEEGDPAAAATA